MSADRSSPFRTLLGFVPVLSANVEQGAGIYYFDGFRWQSDPGREVSRFAMQAKEIVGNSSFEEVSRIAIIARDSIDSIAEELSTKFRQELSRKDMDAGKLLRILGPVDLLASARRTWPDEPDDEPVLSISDDGIEGPQILGAFALLMADYAVDASSRDEPATAVAFMALAGSALMRATMGRTEREKAERRSEATARTELNRAAAQYRWAPLHEDKRSAQATGHELADRFVHRIEAARYIAQNLVKSSSKQYVEEFYEVDTIDDWLKDAGWTSRVKR